MDLLLSGMDFEITKNFLGEAAKANLTNNLIIILILWQLMGKKIAKHFSNVEQSVAKIALEMNELKSAVMADLTLQSKRMSQIENTVYTLKDRVEKLEIQS